VKLGINVHHVSGHYQSSKVRVIGRPGALFRQRITYRLMTVRLLYVQWRHTVRQYGIEATFCLISLFGKKYITYLPLTNYFKLLIALSVC